MAMAATFLEKRGDWNIYSINVDVAAGATVASGGQIVAANATYPHLILGCFLNANVAGTVKIVRGAATEMTGTINIAATGGFVLPRNPIIENFVPSAAWGATAANEAISLVTVTCTIDGILIYATAGALSS